MIKQGNGLERFSELFVYALGKALGFPMAEYYAEDGTVKSPDFTGGASVNYEPMHGLIGDDEDYNSNFNVLWALSPALAEQYVQIIYMDTLCFNMDRHTKNYGILRDTLSGEILSMAPNFDNNIALFARGVPKSLLRSNDKLIALYLDFLSQNKNALAIARNLPLPTRETANLCAGGVLNSCTDNPYTRDACEFVLNGGRQIEAFLTP